MKKTILSIMAVMLMVMAILTCVISCEPDERVVGAPAEFSRLRIANTYFESWNSGGTGFVRQLLPTSSTTLVGTDTTDTLTNKTISGTISSNTNTAQGTANVSAGEGAATVAHGLASTPTIVTVSWMGDTGDDYYIYASSINATSITFSTSANITDNTKFGWSAWIISD